MKLVIVIPAFNEESVIYKVVSTLPRRIQGISKIVKLVVNDGSSDNTLGELEKTDAVVISHPINRGVGAATKTGLKWAKINGADLVVTFDADGQHNPRDLSKIVLPILNRKADVVIGSRFKTNQPVPTDRLILNWLANFATYILFGVFSTDTQSGLRAFSKKALALLDYKNDGMEFSSEILIDAKKHKLNVREVPVDAIYTKYSRDKGQRNLNSIAIFSRFLIKVFR